VRICTPEALSTPLGAWLKRRVLEELRGATTDPGVWRFLEPRPELLDQPRLTDARFAHNRNELAFARSGALQAAREQAKFLVEADKWD
jgi:hypothetical protein